MLGPLAPVDCSMLLEHKLGALIDAARPEHADPTQPLAAALREVDAAQELGLASVDSLSPEALLLCAEAAIKLERHEEADGYLQRFLRSRPPANQFLVRAHYAVAQVAYSRVAHLKADELVSGVLGALEWVQRGLALARTRPSYRFLVYNGSVILYRISRVLLRAGRRCALVGALKAVTSALAEADEPDKAWRLQLAIQLAYAHADAEDGNAALAVATAAAPLADACGAEAVERLFLVQLHLSRVDVPRLRQLVQERASAPRLKALAQCAALRASATVEHGGAPPPDAAAQLLAVLAGVDPALAEVARAASEAGGTPSSAAVAALREPAPHEDLVALAGRVAAELRLLDLAHACAERVVLAHSLQVRVRAQLVREVVRIGRLDAPADGAPAESKVYTRRMVGVRTEALRRLDEALTSAQRCNSPELVTEVVLLMHSTLLPLLQPELLPLVHRHLKLAAAALEAIDSPLSELRAQLHAELARCEVGAEFLQKAAAHVSKGLALDVADVEGQTRLVRTLQPLAERLALRTDVWAEHDAPDIQAYLRFERARSTSDARLRKQALAEAARLLGSAPLRPDAGADEARERALLWAEMLSAAWKDRMTELVHEIAPRLLDLAPSPHAEPRVTRAMAEAHFALAETHVHALSRRGRAPCYRPRAGAGGGGAGGEGTKLAEGAESAHAPPPEAATPPPDESERAPHPPASWYVRGPAPDADASAADVDEGTAAAERAALEHLMKGMRLARLLGEEWLLLNGCVHLWNHHSLAYAARTGGALPLELYDATREAVRHLRALGGASEDSAMRTDLPSLQLACALANALARAQLALARDGGDKRPPPDDDEEQYAAAAAAAASAAQQAAAAKAAAGGGGGAVAIAPPPTPLTKTKSGAKGGGAAPKAAPPPAKPDSAGGGGAGGRGKKGSAAAASAAPTPVGELGAAADACVWACTVAQGRPAAYAEAVRTLVRVQIAQGSKEPWVVAAADPEAKAIALIEAMTLGARTDAGGLSAIEELLKPSGGGSAADGGGAEDGAQQQQQQPAAAVVPRLTGVALHAQLWAQLAERALALQRMHVVVRACEAALALLRARMAAPPSAPPIAPSEWRWFALVEWLHGAALGSLIQEGHARTLVEQLRQQAAAHFAQAAEYAQRAQLPRMVLSAAQAFWGHTLPLARTPAARALASKEVRRVLDVLRRASAAGARAPRPVSGAPAGPSGVLRSGSRMSAASAASGSRGGADPMRRAASAGALVVSRGGGGGGGGSGGGGGAEDDEDSESDEAEAPATARLQQQLYSLVLLSLSEQALWAEGLAALDEAFSALPPSCHEPLWEARVTLMVKGGRGRLVAGEMARLKDSKPDVRASVWLALARAAPSRAETLTAFRRALGALAGEPLAQANVYVEFGEWLFASGFPSKDAEDQMLAAVDLLMDLDDEADEGGGDEGGGAESAAGGDGMSQLLSEIGAGPSGLDSASFASGVGTRPSGLGGKRGSIAGGSVASGILGGMGAAGANAHVGGRGPRHGEKLAATSVGSGSVAGSGGQGGSSGGSGLGVRHFEILMRVYCMLARMAPSLGARVELLTVAAAYLGRMWISSASAASVAEARAVARERLRATSDPAEMKVVRDTALVPGAFGAPTHAVPAEPSAWLTWAPSDRLLELMAADRRDSCISVRSVKRPALTLHYLDFMRGALSAAGLELETAVVLRTAEHIAAHILPATADGAAAGPHLVGLCARRRAALCDRLGLPLAAAAVRAAAPVERLSAEAVTRARADAALFEQTVREARDAGAAPPTGVHADAAVEAARLPAAPHVWLELAAVLAAEGEWAGAEALLAEARAYAERMGDEKRLAWAEHHRAALLAAQGEPAEAARVEARAQCHALAGRATVDFWSASAAALGSYVDEAAVEESEAGATDAAIGSLERCASALHAFAEKHPESAVDAKRARAVLLLAMGRAYGARAERTRAAAVGAIGAPPSTGAGTEVSSAGGAGGGGGGSRPSSPPAERSLTSSASRMSSAAEVMAAETEAAMRAEADAREALGATLAAAEQLGALSALVECTEALACAAELCETFPLPDEGGLFSPLAVRESSLARAAELAERAQACAERVSFVSSTRLTPAPVRTPAERALGRVLYVRARIELARALLQAEVEVLRAAHWRPDFPPPKLAAAGGADAGAAAATELPTATAAAGGARAERLRALDDAVRAFMTPEGAFAPDASHARRAAAHASTAAGLLAGTPLEAEAEAVRGRALLELARFGGEMAAAWAPGGGALEAAEAAPAAEAAETESLTEPTDAEPADAAPASAPELPPMRARARAALRRARALARHHALATTEARAARALAEAVGRADEEEAGAALVLAQALDVSEQARALWSRACPPGAAERRRLCHQRSLRAPRPQPPRLAAALAVEAALHASSPAWRALRVPRSPLHALLDGGDGDAVGDQAEAEAGDDGGAAAAAAASISAVAAGSAPRPASGAAAAGGKGGGKKGGGKGGGGAEQQAAAAAAAAAAAVPSVEFGQLPPGSGVRVLCLTLSAAGDALFALAARALGAGEDGSAGAGAGGGKGAAAAAAAAAEAGGVEAPPPTPRVALVRAPLQLRALHGALASARKLRASLQRRRLQRTREGSGSSAPTDDDGEAGGEGGAPDSRPSTAGAERGADEQALEALLAECNALLGRTTDAAELQAVLAPTAEEEAAAAREGRAASTHLVLSVDARLAELPLEGLRLATRHHIASVSRDFSCAFVARRLGALARGGGGGGGGPVLSKQGWSYVLDPVAEADELRARFEADVLKERGGMVPWAAKEWPPGLSGASTQPAPGDWQAALEKGGGFLYVGLSRLLAYAPPSAVATAGLESCALALLCDQLYTEESIRRQGKLDNKKSAARLELEQPYHSALLLATRGALCVVLNQWASTPSDNRELLITVLTQLADGGLSVAEAVHAIGRKALLEPPPQPAAAEPEAGLPVPAGGAGGKPPGSGRAARRSTAAGSRTSSRPSTQGGGAGKPVSRPMTPATPDADLSVAFELAVDEQPGQRPPITNLCSLLAPVVYGAPLVRMGERAAGGAGAGAGAAAAATKSSGGKSK